MFGDVNGHAIYYLILSYGEVNHQVVKETSQKNKNMPNHMVVKHRLLDIKIDTHRIK
jgi:hypothetical protein